MLIAVDKNVLCLPSIFSKHCGAWSLIIPPGNGQITSKMTGNQQHYTECELQEFGFTSRCRDGDCLVSIDIDLPPSAHPERHPSSNERESVFIGGGSNTSGESFGDMALGRDPRIQRNSRLPDNSSSSNSSQLGAESLNSVIETPWQEGFSGSQTCGASASSPCNAHKFSESQQSSCESANKRSQCKVLGHLNPVLPYVNVSQSCSLAELCPPPLSPHLRTCVSLDCCNCPPAGNACVDLDRTPVLKPTLTFSSRDITHSLLRSNKFAGVGCDTLRIHSDHRHGLSNSVPAVIEPSEVRQSSAPSLRTTSSLSKLVSRESPLENVLDRFSVSPDTSNNKRPKAGFLSSDLLSSDLFAFPGNVGPFKNVHVPHTSLSQENVTPHPLLKSDACKDLQQQSGSQSVLIDPYPTPSQLTPHPHECSVHFSVDGDSQSHCSAKPRRNRKYHRRGSLVTLRKQSLKLKFGRTKKKCREKIKSSKSFKSGSTGALNGACGASLHANPRCAGPETWSSHSTHLIERHPSSHAFKNVHLSHIRCSTGTVNESHIKPECLLASQEYASQLSSAGNSSADLSRQGFKHHAPVLTSKRPRADFSFQCRKQRDRSGRGLKSASSGVFTVVPVNNETNLREQEEAATTDGESNNNNSNNSHSLRVPIHTFDINADGEPTDTLTQNSITSLLSAKFRDVAKRWKQYGVESPRFRKRLHSKWESMNYDVVDSQLQRTHTDKGTSKKRLALTWLSSWLIYFFIGIGTAFLAAGVQISVELVAEQKFGLIRDFLDKCSKEDCLVQPVFMWVGINVGITLVGAALVTYVQPMAAGSGIPLIKSYLNGVRVPGLLSLKAFIAKCVGVILSILGGLACGKEGPMAHSGGIMAAGLGKGRIPWFNKDINLYGMFRNDHNIRDLVAAGAASGVSAAFGAPIGGTLFSVEEAASFWNTELVWKVFFSAMIACFSTNVLLSAFEGHPTQLSNPGLVRFNTFPNLTFDLIEIPVFIVMAAIGGLSGSLFVVMNYKLTVIRQKYLHRHKWVKVAEAGLVSAVSAILAFILMFGINDCTTAEPYSHHAITTTMNCSEGHNSMSTMFLTTPEGCLKSLLHDPLDTYSVLSLVIFIVFFFLLGVWTYGLSVSSGVFIPSLAIGAAWGRLIGMGVVQLFPDQHPAKDVGKYALIGAASQLGGILRTTISLTVIIVECTGDITFGLCIMIALMISKWVGDFFTTGLYDMNVEVSGIPLLSYDPPPLCDHVCVSDFMSQPVMSLLPVEKVGHIVDCLSGETFNGFPIIEQDPNYDLMYKGKLKGIILRHQILVLLQKKIFCPEGQMPTNTITLEDFDNPYPVPQRLKIEEIQLSAEDKNCVMDLTPYMNQTPYVVAPNFSMPRVFNLFRGLGLRHLVVVNDKYEPMGMVTRKDLAKYRAEIKKGMLHMQQLTVENR